LVQEEQVELVVDIQLPNSLALTLYFLLSHLLAAVVVLVVM
jgi:hypothetical protein